MDIYTTLMSKNHNPHYLNRYIKFIKYCKTIQQAAPCEIHHILPKAADLFPEYKSLAAFPHNKILLSPRCHYIAHLLLWKAYKGSQTRAFALMSNRFCVTSRMYESAKIEISTSMLGNLNHNKAGTYSKDGWAQASSSRREKQSQIMKTVNATKLKPKELRYYTCADCNAKLVKEEPTHHLPKPHYYCNSTCRNRFSSKHRQSQKGITKPGHPAWNKGLAGSTTFGTNNPMKNPEIIQKMLESRARNKEAALSNKEPPKTPS